MKYWDDMLYLAVSNKLHIYDISISFDKELKMIQEIKNINFIFIDAQSRLFTVQDKMVCPFSFTGVIMSQNELENPLIGQIQIKCYEKDFDDAKGLRFQSQSEITAFTVIDYDDGTKSNVIYGCRDHSIRSQIHNYHTGTTQEVQIFDQPHLDTGDKHFLVVKILTEIFQ